MAQLVNRPTWAQVMISRFVSSSPAWGSVLTALSLEPVSDFVFPSLSAPPPLLLCLSKINKNIFKNIKKLPRTGVAGFYGKYMFNCLRNHQNVFQSGCIGLHSYQKSMKVSLAVHP